MSQEFIQVAGIRPGSASNVRPEGLHLRWSFPPRLGFPTRGFEIYRRKHTKDGAGLTKLEPLPDGTVIETGREIQNLRFELPQTAQLTYKHIRASNRSIPFGFSLQAQSQGFLSLEFLEPVTQVELTFGSGPGVVSAYSGERQVYISTQRAPSYTIPEEANTHLITRLEIRLDFDWLRSISYTTLSTICRLPEWGQPVVRLPLLIPANELKGRLEAGIRNRYVRDRGEASGRYGDRAEEMLEWLLALQNPGGPSLRFEDPGVSPDRLRFERAANDPGRPLNVYPQQILLLAALDPNIARMLSLYWVDRYGAPNGPAIDTAYDYKIVGRWRNNVQRCGLLFNLGATETQQPSPPARLSGEQLSGLSWKGAVPFGRVGLRWRNQTTHTATRAVFYDVYRDGVHLTQDRPVLAPGPQPEIDPAPAYIDPEVEISPGRIYQYTIVPVDVFGQVGEESGKLDLEVKDLPAPPPPVRLQTWQPDPAHPGRLWLQFEYGAYSHIQAPNARSFRLHRRSDALRPALQARVTALGERTVDGKKMVLVQLGRPQPGGQAAPLSPAELRRFSEGVASWVSIDPEKRLPAKERRHSRIEGIAENPAGILLKPPFELLDAGRFELLLAAAPQRKDQWLSLPVPNNPKEIFAVAPIRGRLSQAPGSFLRVNVVDVPQRGPNPDPFAALQRDPSLQGILPASFPNLPALPKIVEVVIDRDLIDPDIFVSPGGEPGDFSGNGTAEAPGGRSFTIAYVIPGGVGADGKDRGARLGLLGEPSLVTGRPLSLNLAAWTHDQVRCLTISGQVDPRRLGIAGGDILLEVTRHERNPLVGQVVSSAANQGGSPGTFDFLVRFPDGQTLGALKAQAEVAYFAPYRELLDFDLTNDNPANGLALKIPDGKGTRTVYLAANTRTTYQNAITGSSISIEGPLGLPAPFTVVRQAPGGKPGKPYPCGLNSAAGEGYASPPDLHGRATIHLCWEPGDVAPATGLRYEVARALDTTIVAVHLRNWQLGKVQQVGAALASGLPSAHAPLSRLQPEAGQPDPAQRGVIAVRLAPVSPDLDPAHYRNGRLLDQSGAAFQVTLARRNGSSFDLLLRSAAGAQPASGPATLDAPPRYDSLLADAAALANLAAAQAGDAFGLATGVPIEGNEFLDEVPGKGESRYFYRVRAVDAAGNPSEWSDVSVPFHTVDTTPPEAPIISKISGGERKATIHWLRAAKPGVMYYELFRSIDPDDLAFLHEHNRIARIPVYGNPARELVFHDAPLAGLGHGEFYYYRIVSIKTVQAGPHAKDLIEIESVPSDVIRVPVFDTTPKDPHGS